MKFMQIFLIFIIFPIYLNLFSILVLREIDSNFIKVNALSVVITILLSIVI